MEKSNSTSTTTSPTYPPNRRLVLASAVALSALVCAAAVAQFAPPPPPPPNNGQPQSLAQQGFGAPLPGLSQVALAAFQEGREEFVRPETPAGGLGPIFNGRSCVECHSQPVVGGASRIAVTRFGRMENGVFDPLDNLGGSLLQRFSINPAIRETIPHEANVVTQRITTPLFGLGLIEAIPDSAILQNMLTAKADGVKGRVAEITDVVSGNKRIGRFGWKAQQATVLAFSADAYTNEMGITNRFFPKENAPNGDQALLARFKRTSDPENTLDTDGRGDIDVVADYMRLLAPPPRGPITAAVLNGETVFTAIGCAACHTPSMRTGASRVPALDLKVVALYSDLLLHDMGRLSDGIAQGAASTHEMKTAPLWGLRARNAYLHDGRATTVDGAIRLHDGEGLVSRDRYARLTPQQRQQLLDFLGSL